MKLYSSVGIFILAFLSLLTYEHYVNLTQRFVLLLIIVIQYKLKLN